jgi:hypothetical protein
VLWCPQTETKMYSKQKQPKGKTMKVTLTKERILEVAATQTTIGGLIRGLGYSSVCGATSKKIKAMAPEVQGILAANKANGVSAPAEEAPKTPAEEAPKTPAEEAPKTPAEEAPKKLRRRARSFRPRARRRPRSSRRRPRFRLMVIGPHRVMRSLIVWHPRSLLSVKLSLQGSAMRRRRLDRPLPTRTVGNRSRFLGRQTLIVAERRPWNL